MRHMSTTEPGTAGHHRLETARLLLRPVTLADAEAVFEYGSDPEATRYVLFPTHRSVADAHAWLETVEQSRAAGGTVPWALELKENGTVIGTCGFTSWQPSQAEAEIGYALSRRFWNRGFATEAVRAMVRFGFERAGLQRIVARVAPENAASWRVLEKVGFEYERTLRDEPATRPGMETFRVYGITPGLFRRLQESRPG